MGQNAPQLQRKKLQLCSVGHGNMLTNCWEGNVWVCKNRGPPLVFWNGGFDGKELTDEQAMEAKITIFYVQRFKGS